MTNSDQLMLAAVKAQVPFIINDREVMVDGEKTTVSLFGMPVAAISPSKKEITLYGQTPVTRKSARVFNTLLKDMSEFRMKSRAGQWIIQGPAGEILPVQDCTVTVSMTEEKLP